MARRVLPYKSPVDVVRAGEWQLTVDGEEMPLPEAYPHWDYQTDLRLRRTVQVDLAGALSGATLAPDTDLTVAAIWTSSGSRLRGIVSRVLVPDSGAVELKADLAGSELGGVVLLDTALVLTRRRSGDDRPIAPRRAGSVLWSDRSQIRLQGDAPQFPVAVVDFARTDHPEDAAWYLEIGSNLNAATMGALLLLVNEKKTVVAEAMQRAANPRREDRLILAMVYADVARTMVDHALRLPDFSEDTTYIDETLGATLQELFGRLFPDRSVVDIRLTAEHSPGRFASELQAAVKIFEGL
ncbi:hypothetical protein [Nocardia higoensis]|uniref:hypothetical protein n=1 Tax=Nocardia higoensis TaxID=228599 RepID=UPI001C3F1D64|nr:hypothetical protein [Nocardia higoensis]